jgi:hypothetical protein
MATTGRAQAHRAEAAVFGVAGASFNLKFGLLVVVQSLLTRNSASRAAPWQHDGRRKLSSLAVRPQCRPGSAFSATNCRRLALRSQLGRLGDQARSMDVGPLQHRARQLLDLVLRKRASLRGGLLRLCPRDPGPSSATFTPTLALRARTVLSDEDRE